MADLDWQTDALNGCKRRELESFDRTSRKSIALSICRYLFGGYTQADVGFVMDCLAEREAIAAKEMREACYDAMRLKSVDEESMAEGANDPEFSECLYAAYRLRCAAEVIHALPLPGEDEYNYETDPVNQPENIR